MAEKLIRIYLGEDDTPQLGQYAKKARGFGYLTGTQGIIVQVVEEETGDSPKNSVVVRVAGGMLNNCIARTVKELTHRSFKVEIDMTLCTYTGTDLHNHDPRIVQDRIDHFKLAMNEFDIPENMVSFVTESERY